MDIDIPHIVIMETNSQIGRYVLVGGTKLHLAGFNRQWMTTVGEINIKSINSTSDVILTRRREEEIIKIKPSTNLTCDEIAEDGDCIFRWVS